MDLIKGSHNIYNFFSLGAMVTSLLDSVVGEDHQ